mmetsp:Transcript_14065/g.25735  ORF Transcript_14065/g.25735 Transcript_14065/m.25735 type:complete len:1736 (+) Transcript_14065:159-5366(+)
MGSSCNIWYFLVLLLLAKLTHVEAASACREGDSKCLYNVRARGSCGYWHNEQKYCPDGYPYNDNDSSSYCWGLKVHIYCYACAPGYRDAANTCGPCPGGYESGVAATSCTKCGLGKYSTGAEVCKPCEAGKYANDPGQPLCKLCRTKGGGSVHWYSAAGASDCTHCPAGQVVNENSDGCESCTDGKYVDKDFTECLPCSPGKSSGSSVGMPDHSSCSNCPAGRFSGAGGLCEACPAGTYSGAGQAEIPNFKCIQCSAGEYSLGTTGEEGNSDYSPSTTCLHCPAGKKSADLTGSSECLYCSPGKYTNEVKSSQCVFCDPGKTSNGTDTTTGEYVSVGEFKPNDDNIDGPKSCYNCAAGKYTNAQKSNVCVNCEAGTYSNVGATICTQCQLSDTYGPGYVSDEGSPDCTPCPAGTESENNVCQNCTKGYYSLQGAEECSPCKPGTYMPNNGTSVCYDCPKNTFQDKFGKPFCEACPDGKTSGGGDIVCSSCPDGTWSDDAAVEAGGTAGACWACGAGKRVKGNRCRECDAGRYSPVPAGFVAESDYSDPGCSNAGVGGASLCGLKGNYQCSYCAVGQDTNNQTGSSSCTVCSEGKYKYEPTEMCTWCPAGKAAGGFDGNFKTSEAEVCIDCLPGKHSGPGPEGHVGKGATSCANCPNGRYSNTERAANCTICEEGKYALIESGTNGAVACSLCVVGRYNNKTEQSLCALCQPGTYQKGLASTKCDDCPAGKYADDMENTVCSFCNQPTGSTSGSISAPGATECTKCPPGSASGLYPGVTFCESCEGGKYTDGEGQRTCDDCDSGKYAPDPNADVLPDDFTAYPTLSPTKAPTTSSPTLPGTTGAPSPATTAPSAAPTKPATSSPTMAPTPWSLTPDPNGASQCTLCGVGRFSRDGRSMCELCPAGRWTPASTETPGGEGTPASSLNYVKASCTECPVGKYSNISRALCNDCENPDVSQGVYSSWAEVGSDTCYLLHTAERFGECPKSNGKKRSFDASTMTYEETDKESICRWYFIDDFTGQDFSTSIEGSGANEGEASPFVEGVADSCGNYTLCKADPNDDDEDHYLIACQDCAEGYISAGTHTFGSNQGACSGKTVQRYCYKPTTLDLCPPDTTCQYRYKGDTVTKDGDEADGGHVSPFFDEDVETDPSEPYVATACDSYRVCGFGGFATTKQNDHYLDVVCEKCAEGFISVAGDEKVYDASEDSEWGESSTCPGSYPTTCMNVMTTFDKCPKCQLGKREMPDGSCQDSRRLREWAEQELEIQRETAILEAQAAHLRGSRELPFVIDACTTCSCTGTNVLSPCDLNDQCESSKSGCQSSYCQCNSIIPDVPDPDDINTDPGEYTVQCKYLYSTWKGEDLDEDDPELWETDWESVGAGVNSPFNNVANQDDPCEYYKLCQFETKFGGNLDEYHIACGKCREENDYYMAVDFEESQVKDEDGWMCTNENPAATHCYHWPKSSYEQFFVDSDHDCNDITFNPKQRNECYYWKGTSSVEGGTWVKSTGKAKEGPFGISCGSYEVCAFDAADGEVDNYYLQCSTCAAGYVMVYKDNNNTDAKSKGCTPGHLLPPNSIVTECVKATEAPSITPTDRPTVPVTQSPVATTSAPTAGGGGGVSEKLSDPIMLGGVGGGAVILILLVAYIIKSRNQKQQREQRKKKYDPRDTEGSGFEMSNPMSDKKKKKKSKKEKKKKRSRESSDDSDSDSDSDSEEDSGEDNKYSLASFFKGDESGGKTQMN